MPLPRLLVTILLALSTITLASAQQRADELPQGIEALRQGASSKTEFTLDHSMLILASKLDSNDGDLVRVIAGVSGVSVHRYRFAGPWTYDMDVLRSVKDQYQSAGWMQIVNKHDRDGLPGATDLWIRWQNDVISNIAVLVARSEEVTFVEVARLNQPTRPLPSWRTLWRAKIEGGVRAPSQHR